MPINVELERKGRNKAVKLEIKGRPVADYVIEVAPIEMSPNDTLTVTVNVEISGFVNDVKTSTYHDRYKYTAAAVTETKTVRYIRFTKHQEQASIQVYEKLPTDFYNPPVWNATKID